VAPLLAELQIFRIFHVENLAESFIKNFNANFMKFIYISPHLFDVTVSEYVQAYLFFVSVCNAPMILL